jgi:hypothetical protein
VCATFGNFCAGGVADINVPTLISCDSILDFETEGFPTVNINTGGSLDVVNEPFCTMTMNVGDLLVRFGGKITVNKSRRFKPGKVTVNASGTITVEDGGVITAIGGRGQPNATIELFADGDILIAGLLEARGKTTLAHGGHIIIESENGRVTISGAALVLTSSTDPGGTLIRISACLGIDIFGLVDATSKKGQAEIELFSRGEIRIIGGVVVADVKIGELGPGEIHKVTIEARDSIILESALVSANTGATNKVGGTIEMLSTEGEIICNAASLITANATGGGSDGGVGIIRSFENLTYDCVIEARGNRTSGNGGTLLLQSFDQDVLGTGNVNASGNISGAIILKAAANPITDGGTFDPLPSLLAGQPEAAPKIIDPCTAVPTPAIDLEKFVNGEDADVCPGVNVAAGSTLNYEYKVTNTGTTVLVDIEVTDDKLGR